MKELIYNNLANGNEILGVLLAMLYFIVPMLIIGGVIYFAIMAIDEIGTRREMRYLTKDRDLYEFAKRKYNR